MSMKKCQYVDRLAVRVKKNKSSDDFQELKQAISNIIDRVKASYKPSDINRIDFDSVVDISIIRALGTYKKSKGRFDYHAYRWIHENVKREVIKSSEIKIPYRLAKHKYALQRDGIDLRSVDKKDKEAVKARYGISDKEYEFLLDISIYKPDQITADLDWDIGYDPEYLFELQSALEETISILEPREIFIISSYYALPGYTYMDNPTLATFFRVSEEDIMIERVAALNKLRDSGKTTKLLGGFYYGDNVQ